MSGGQSVRPCDHRSVGVIIEREDRFLVFDRNTFPSGAAPVTGHVDDGDVRSAALAEVREETGLTVMNMAVLAEGWRSNVCRRPLTGERDPGHQWTVYRAQVDGELAPSPRETRNVRWADRGELQRLADRTAAYAHGVITDAAWQSRPGLEPVWVSWLTIAGLVVGIAPRDLKLIDNVASRPAGGWR